MEIDKKSTDMISKFAIDAVKELKEERVSKFANEVDANSLDASSVTVSRKFTELVRLVRPQTPLVEAGIVRVQDVEPNTDKAIFTTQLQQSFTWTEFDARGSEITSLAAGSGSFQSYTAPNYLTVTPTTKTTTLFLFDNISLVNPIRMAEIMAQTTEEIAMAKELAAYTILASTGLYTASVSIKQASGYTDLLTESTGTAASYVTTGSVLIPSDLVAAKKDLKTSGNRKIRPNVVLLATEQLSDLETHADMSPGQSSNANFKKAVYDENGTLIRFDGMEIIESQEMPAITTGYFASVTSGHFVYVGQKNLMIARGEHSAKNKVESFRNPRNHGTELTMDVSYNHGHLFSKSMRIIAASDT